MDAQRFDNLAKSLAGRCSRRKALRRAGTTGAASLLAAIGIRPDAAPALARAQSDGQPLFTLIRRYPLNGSADQVRNVLAQGYVQDACQAPGFVAYFTVEDADGDFATVAVFRSQADLENFANAEANWIAQNLDDLLPSPDEAISGDTYIHGAALQAFPNTCPASPAPSNGPAPTAVPPTPTPACTAQGCVCTTGTQSPCDDGLVCCPTTDLMGGPGVCQPESVCYPNQCLDIGDACPRSCGTTDACPACCSNYCNANGVCDNPPPPCTGEGCTCATGTQSPCDDGLVCCGTSGVPGAPGTCLTEAECYPPCTGENCDCDPSNANSCDQGLTCCAVQSGYICISSEQCGPAPCTGEGCTCFGGAPGACDAGLVCCLNEVPVIGGYGGCVPEAQCSSAGCTGEFCDCIGGTEGACDDGLICCVQGDPGAPGTCQTSDNCAASICTGQDCPCAVSDPSACADGLICCGPNAPGAQGTCQTPTDCTGGCGDYGEGCLWSCGPDTYCDTCCSGYCSADGVCDDAPPVVCTGIGCDCDSGTNSPCEDDLICCPSTDVPGGPGICQMSC